MKPIQSFFRAESINISRDSMVRLIFRDLFFHYYYYSNRFGTRDMARLLFVYLISSFVDARHFFSQRCNNELEDKLLISSSKLIKQQIS